MRENGYYALLSLEGFVRMVCDRLRVRDCDVSGVRTAVYMSPETGWQSFSSLSEQIYTYKRIYIDNKDNWFVAWYFHFPESTKIDGSLGPRRNPREPIQVQIVGTLNHRSTAENQSEQVSNSAIRRESSSGAESNETMWPAFPFENKTTTATSPHPDSARSRAYSQGSSHHQQSGTASNSHRGGEGLVQKVSKIPKRIAKSLAVPTPPTQANAFAPRPLTRPEPRERPTVLTALACELKQGGIDDVNGLLPVTKAPSRSQWRICCQLLPHLDADQLAQKDPRARSITLLNTKLALAPFQLWTAYQILQGGGAWSGGYLAHGMGLGKTHCVLAAVALKALIAGSQKRCDEFWALQPTRGRAQAPRHLPRNAMANPEFNRVCPSQRPGDVQCWCVPGGVTRQLGQSLVPGASVVSVPSDLMSDWVKAVLQADFKPSSYNFIVLGGSEVPAHLRQDLGLLTAKFKMSASVPAKQPVVRDALDLTWTNRTTLGAAGTYMFLTSHHNPTLHDTFRYRPRDLGVPPNAGPRFEAETLYGAPVGLHFIDEAHLPGVWTPQNHPMQLARRHKHITGCDVWFVSSTPFPRDRFREVRAQIALLSSELAPALASLDDRYQEAKYKLSPDKIHRFIRDFQRLFRDDMVLRFVDTTLFFDQPITGVQDVDPFLVSRRLSSSIIPLRRKTGGGRGNISRKALQKLVDRLQTHLPPHLPYVDRLESKKHVADVLYFVSLFPAAAPFLNNNKTKLALHDDALRQEIQSLPDRKRVTDIPLVQGYWERFARDSPKLQYLREEIDRIAADVGPVPHRRPKKCVVLTPNLSSAVFLYAWFAHNPSFLRMRNNNNVRPVFYHRDLSRKDKVQIRDAFSATTTVLDPGPSSSSSRAVPPSSSYKNYFIACVEDAGTGLNLQAANYQLLTSPLHRATDQAQAFRRTNRAGQDLPLVHKLLVLEDSPIDRINLVAQARRRFKSDPFDVLSQGGTVELCEVSSPASESSQEDLARVVGVRPLLGEAE